MPKLPTLAVPPVSLQRVRKLLPCTVMSSVPLVSVLKSEAAASPLERAAGNGHRTFETNDEHRRFNLPVRRGRTH